MRRLADLGLVLAFVASLGLVASVESCTHPPPSLSAAGQLDYNKTRVLKALDLVRDTAIDAEAAHLIATEDTRQIVLWHKSAVSVVEVAGTGWKATVTTTLDQVLSHLSTAAQTKLGPYVALLKALIGDI
jgi:hypothetical protein